MCNDPTVIALDRANAEDALLPIPKIFDSHEKKKRHEKLSFGKDEVMADLDDSGSHAGLMKSKGGHYIHSGMHLKFSFM